jgi:hypothetical protein
MSNSFEIKLYRIVVPVPYLSVSVLKVSIREKQAGVIVLFEVHISCKIDSPSGGVIPPPSPPALTNQGQEASQ